MRNVIYARCPACGGQDLLVAPEHSPDPVDSGAYGVLRCWREECPDPDAANRLLSDAEIHHVVRFDSNGYFNVKHPLRERIDSELLDCSIHPVVVDAVADERITPRGSWRLIAVPATPDQEPDWEFEPC